MRNQAWLNQLAEQVSKPDGRHHFEIQRIYPLIGAWLGVILLTIFVLGLRPDWAEAIKTFAFWIKIAFPLTLSGLAWIALKRVGIPGARFQAQVLMLLLYPALFALLMLYRAQDLYTSAAIETDLFGQTWVSCPLTIAGLSLILLFAGLWCARPWGVTLPTLSGGLIGFISGALTAGTYALHCQETGGLFLATWYVLGAFMPAMIGAALGRRWLMW
jgi:hypothetical protein